MTFMKFCKLCDTIREVFEVSEDRAEEIAINLCMEIGDAPIDGDLIPMYFEVLNSLEELEK